MKGPHCAGLFLPAWGTQIAREHPVFALAPARTLHVPYQAVCFFDGTGPSSPQNRMVNVNSILQVPVGLAKMGQKTAEMPRTLLWGEFRCAG